MIGTGYVLAEVENHGGSRMKIALVSQFVYPHGHEIRLKKISQTLVNDGYDVVVLCKWEAGLPVLESLDGIEIHRNAPARWAPKLNAALTLHLAYNPVWFIWLLLKCRALGVDTLIVRNLRLGLPAILAARVLGLSMIADLSENYRRLPRSKAKTGLKTSSPEPGPSKRSLRSGRRAWPIMCGS